jgi:hypothetical protein
MRLVPVVILISAGLLLPKPVLSDTPPGIPIVSGQIAADGSVNVKAKLGTDLSSNIANTKMLYRNWVNGTPIQNTYSQVLPNIDLPSLTVTFQLAANIFTNADQIEYFLETDDASGKPLAQSSHYQLSFMDQRSVSQCLAQSKVKDDTIADLNRQLSALNSQIIPSAIGAEGNGLITSETATFHLTTNQYGKIRVEARRADNPSVTDAIYVSPSLSKDHAVSLNGLTPNKNYKLVGYILNHLSGGTYNAANPIQLAELYQQLAFTTLAKTPVPVLTVTNPEATTNSIVISALVDQGYITVLLEAPSDPLRGTWKKVDARGAVSIDKYGIVTSNSTDHTPYSFTSLTPSTQYRLTISAVNQYGATVASPEVRVISTNSAPPTFAFTGSVQLSMGVSGFTASWTATSKPLSGSFEVDFGDGQPIVSQPATVKENTLTATLDVNGLKQVIQKAQKPGAPAPAPPTLHFIMKNSPDGAPQEERFVVNYVVPTSQQVQDAKQNGVITDQQSKALLNVVGSVSNTTKKFSWSDLLTTGLGLVLKFI